MKLGKETKVKIGKESKKKDKEASKKQVKEWGIDTRKPKLLVARIHVFFCKIKIEDMPMEWDDRFHWVDGEEIPDVPPFRQEDLARYLQEIREQEELDMTGRMFITVKPC